MKLSYDSRCYALAEAFFEDAPELATEDHVDMLAYLIQGTIEDYFFEIKHPPPHPIRSVEP